MTLPQGLIRTLAAGNGTYWMDVYPTRVGPGTVRPSSRQMRSILMPTGGGMTQVGAGARSSAGQTLNREVSALNGPVSLSRHAVVRPRA
jgi:hypothetical protein